ncbi:MAG: adenosine deaminase [Thermoanaerobaculia bacterium]
MSLDSFLRAIPKAELHVHLEGAMRPRTLLELARRRGVSLPADNVEGLREWFRFRDFDHFVQIYVTCSKAVQHPEDFQTLVRDFAQDQAAENIRYSEVHFTIGTHWLNGVAIDEVLDAMTETIREMERDEGVTVRLIPDIVRDVAAKTADLTLDWAIAAHRKGVAVALGMTGREALFPSEPLGDHFAEAARQGLHCVAHAGELAGPASVHSVLDSCRAERIGHGVRSIEDSGLIARLRDGSVPLEVCPSSNVCLGLFPDLAHHPLDDLRRAGLRVSINSDDPALFDTTLSDEFRRVAETWNDTPETLAGLALAGFEHSFLPDPEKRAAIESARAAMRELAPTHLGRELAI